MDPRVYQIALSMTPNLGCKGCRQIVNIEPDAEKIFHSTRQELEEMFPCHQLAIDNIVNGVALPRAQKELEWIDRYGLKALYFTDPDFPQRLNAPLCDDAPIVLYYQGTCNLNAQRVVGIVGARRATEYGFSTTNRIVREMQQEGVLIASGLAYGIDSAAHTAAVDYGLPTVGVLGHGLDQIYPPQNRTLAKRIIDHGGALLTEFCAFNGINKNNFPARNRIIAGISDIVLVVEAAKHGGALITAYDAMKYRRQVCTIPGRLGDPYSEGCNNLIADGNATMVRNADDIFKLMNWNRSSCATSQSPSLFLHTLTAEEQTVYSLLKQYMSLNIDELCTRCSLTRQQVSNALLSMEMKNLINIQPGKRYTIKA